MVAKKGEDGFNEGSIFIKRARENNLKNLTVELPRGKLIGVTGVSGSGKSSLVFDVMAAEGHRKYVESLSTQARQALEKFDGRMWILWKVFLQYLLLGKLMRVLRDRGALLPVPPRLQITPGCFGQLSAFLIVPWMAQGYLKDLLMIVWQK